MQIALRHVPMPEATRYYPPPTLPASEYESRITKLQAAAPNDWVIVYGDREHNANLAFVSGFDPRFEEALLLLSPTGARTLIVGNEGLGYTPLLPIPLDIQLCQSLSLMGQPRDTAAHLGRILRNLGLGEGASIGIVGWKYLEPEEVEDPTQPAFVPAMLVNALRQIVGTEGRLYDATKCLSHPTSGLKSVVSATQIIQYAWAAERVSEAVWRIVRGARPGMNEYFVAGLMQYQGEPLSCHVMVASDSGPIVGLRSPSSRQLRYGDGITTAIGYWGGLSCRAGLLQAEPDQHFVAEYVIPYYRAIATWWSNLRIGISGGELHRLILEALSGAPFQPALNPGHLIALDEWSHTPIRPGSSDLIASGMVLQCDIIPTPMPAGKALNCEDTVAIADQALQAEIATLAPDLWLRIQQRRQFMLQLGIELPAELLPLSTAPAYFAPFWLDPELVCCVER